MRHLLLEAFADVREQLSKVRVLSLFLDFDGTLTRIVSDPGDVQLDPSVRDALAAIVETEAYIVSVISGRSLEDLRSRVGMSGLIYAGNHGLEIHAPDFDFVEPFAQACRNDLERISDKIARGLESIGEAQVEYKQLTTSVHHRNASAEDVPAIWRVVDSVVDPYSWKFRIRLGRHASEIVPRTDWNKGTAVRWINNKMGITDDASIYMGDDASDEEAFRALPRAITFKVGNSESTCARYVLEDPAEVLEFLRLLSVNGAHS